LQRSVLEQRRDPFHRDTSEFDVRAAVVTTCLLLRNGDHARRQVRRKYLYSPACEPHRVLTGPAPKFENLLTRLEHRVQPRPDQRSQCSSDCGVREGSVVAIGKVVERRSDQGVLEFGIELDEGERELVLRSVSTEFS